jgi:dTDP-4-dehydrorhamnose 3,5-epimerase
MEIALIGDTGLTLVRMPRHGDARGWLSEVFSEAAFRAAGLPDRFVQDNISHTPEAGAVRGLHFQRPPHWQAKLFRVVRGAAYNIALDLRPARFGAVDQRRLEADPTLWMLIPEGFAHGFQSLEPGTEVHYKVTRPYQGEALGTVDWRDESLGIRWPIPPRLDLASKRDATSAPAAAFRGLAL